MLLSPAKFAEAYGKDLSNSTYTGYFSISGLSGELRRSSSPVRVKDIAMQAVELFVEGQFPSRGWTGNIRRQLEQRASLLDTVLSIGKKVVRGFYSGNPLQPQEIWTLLYPRIDDFMTFSWGSAGDRDRHLNGESEKVLAFAHRMAKDDEAKNCDIVAAIANGGIEPALLVAENLGIEKVIPLAFSRYRYQDKNVCAPFWWFKQSPLEIVHGKRVLVVDDSAHAQERTLKEVEHYLISHGAESTARRVVDYLENPQFPFA